MTLSETTTMATDTSLTGNHTHELMEEQKDDFIGEHEKQEQSDGPIQQDKLQQRTLALVKPDAVQANHQQAIIDRIISAGFTIIQQKQVQITLAQACLFYREHESKSFYDELTKWMSSAPIYAMVLEKENAIQDWRTLMGPTNSIKAREIDPTSIRALFGTDGSQNATHGSDCLTSAEREIDILFANDIFPQSDLSTVISSTDHNDSFLQHDTSNKEQTLATTTKETDSSCDDDVLETKATTATDDTESFVPPAEATLLHTNNDVEHPVSTSDSLSHPATPDHYDAQHNNDAPTCPKSDFVELPSGDTQQSATVTTSNNTIQESTTTITDLQESIFQANTDNKEPAHMKPNMGDETLEENGSQYDTGCNYDVSLSDQHQHQQEPSFPATEDMIDNENESMIEQSTPTNTHSEQQQHRQSDGDKDQIVSLDSAGPDIAYTEEKVGEQEKELESTTKVSETSITSAADDNINQTTDHGVDSIVNNISTNDSDAIDTISAEHQIDQDLKKAKEDDDYQSITPEQETESLSIQDATTATETVATTTIDTTDIDDENDHAIDITLAAATYDIKSTDFTTIESTIHDSEKASDADKEESTTYQDTKNTVDESHDDGADINTTDGHFDSIPLAVDQEKSKEAVTMNDIPMAGEPDADADETTTTTEVIGPTSSDVTMLKPGTDAVEDTSIPVELTSETTVLEPTTSAENTSILGAVGENHNDGGAVEQVYVMEGEPESGKELCNIAGESVSIEQSIPEVAVTDESESTSLETLPQDAVADEHESTKESIAVGELDATQNDIPVDTTADDIEHLKKPDDDDELQATDISLSEVAVANTVEYSKVMDESEYAKEHVTNIGIDGPSEDTPAEEQMEHAQTPQSQTLAEAETSDVVEPIAMDKPPTLETETETEDKHEQNTTPTDDHQAPSDVDDQAKQQLEKTTVDKSDSLSSHDEDAAVDSSKTTKSEENPVKERKIAPTSPPASTTRSPGRKLPTSTAKTPVKSTSPPTTTKKLPAPGTGPTKPATTSRLRRPGTTQATGTGSSATTTTGTSVKKATPKTSTSPGRTPLPRVATLAKKPVSKTTDESKPSTTEPKPATTTNKKRSSVISRLTAPTAASANKRTSEAAASSTPASTTKTASGNGTIRTKVTSTSGHHAPTTTRRPISKVSTATDKPTTKRTNHSSTADKTLTATTRRTSPPSSTTVHSKTARSTTAAPTSSRVSSTTTKPPSTDASAAKRSPTRRVSPPTSTLLKPATKPITKSSKPSTTEKKMDVIHKKTKTSGPTTATITSNTVDKSDNKEQKDDINAHLETIQNDDSAVENDDECVKKSDEDTDHLTIEEHNDEDLNQEVITSEQPSIVQTTIQHEETTATDIEVSTTTTKDNASLNPTTTDSNTKRPRTPEMAQLRNKFENLQAPTTVTPTRSSNKQPSSAPHNIKDLISRFN